METVSLIVNTENKYVDKDNKFFKKLKLDEFKKNEVFSIENDILLHYWKDKSISSSIFSEGISKPSYFKMNKEHILRLIYYLIHSNFSFHIESNFKVNPDTKEFLTEYIDIYNKNNGNVFNNQEIDELFNDFSYLFDNMGQYAFKIYKKIDKEYVCLTLNNIFVCYTDLSISKKGLLLNEAIHLYKIALDKNISLTPVTIELKKAEKKPNSHIIGFVEEIEKIIEEDDSEKLFSFMKDNKENMGLIKKAFK